MRLPLLLLCCACNDPVPSVLVEPWAWSESAVDLLEHDTSEVPCLPEGWHIDNGGMEVETGPCPYANLTQPALARVRAGDTLHVRAWHQSLISLQPSQGHIALLSADGVLWEHTVDIPHPAQAWDERIVSPIDVPVGDALYLHVHNHGSNSWNLHSVDIEP